MPRIQQLWHRKPIVYGWQDKSVREKPFFSELRPKHATSNPLGHSAYRPSFVDGLKPSQIFISDSRQRWQAKTKRTLANLPKNTTIHMKWRISKETPAFSMDFLYAYLMRFGRVDAIYQLAANECLVVFTHEQTARTVKNDLFLGHPFGRLYAKWWNPLLTELSYYRTINHLERSSESRAKCEQLKHMNDRAAQRNHHNFHCRELAQRSHEIGPTVTDIIGAPQSLKTIFDKSADDQVSAKRRGTSDILRPVVHLVKNYGQLIEFFKSIPAERLVVLDFFATWCPPCIAINMKFQKWAEQYPNVTFIKIDVDENEETADIHGVHALPTLVFMKGREQIGQIAGAAAGAIEDMIIKNQ